MAEGYKDEKGKSKEKKSGGGPEGVILEVLPFIGIFVAVYLVYMFFQDGGGPTSGTEGVRVILGAIHDVLTSISTIVSMVFVALTVYFAMRYSEILTKNTKEIREHFARRKADIHDIVTGKRAHIDWARIDEYMKSQNPSDWKVAILEADIMLDDVILTMGAHGDTMGERMKSLDPKTFPYLDYAWEAHKFRNDLAHASDRPLVRHEADRVIGLYERVFRELKVL